MDDFISIEGPVDLVGGELMIRIPLSAGGDELAACPWNWANRRRLPLRHYPTVARGEAANWRRQSDSRRQQEWEVYNYT
jgi:hypothetical protein